MKGIIVAAGYGTRFLPVTKTLPKEMLPLLNKPSLAFIVEEFLASGIRDIIVITSRRKRSIEDYLDREVELEALFQAEGALDKLAAIRPYDAHFSFVRQTEMRGTGHALLAAKPFLDGEPAVVAYPDDLHFGSPPLTAQLIAAWKKTGCCVMASLHNPPHLERYGVLKLASDGLHVEGLVEKPAPGQEPSREASLGRYLYLPEFFDHLEEGWKNHTGREYFHVYALERMMEQEKVVFHPAQGERLDTGDLAGFFQATLRYARQFPELVAILKEEARNLGA
ncbi:MAG: NTP transferase domain-containing protein [Spirochaetales bacterium]|nr:NTP transferase domain-containing protein [Spirochaetales bacterium]